MKTDYSELYTQMHKNPKYFPGYGIKNYVQELIGLVATVQPRRILDYGCGKGYQYLALRVHEQWGGPLPYCYDVGVRQLWNRPEGKFDAVLCTDMMEHILDRDVPEVLDDIFGFLTDEDRPTFAFFTVACRPADRKELPDGRNVHLTVQTPAWWLDEFRQALRRRAMLPKLQVVICFDMPDKTTRKEAL